MTDEELVSRFTQWFAEQYDELAADASGLPVQAVFRGMARCVRDRLPGPGPTESLYKQLVAVPECGDVPDVLWGRAVELNHEIGSLWRHLPADHEAADRLLRLHAELTAARVGKLDGPAADLGRETPGVRVGWVSWAARTRGEGR